MGGHVPVVHVQLVEDHLVEAAPEAGACFGVEVLRVAQEVEGGQEVAAADVDLAGGVCELGQDLVALAVDDGELLLDLVVGPAGVADQVQEAVFFGAQFLQAGCQLLAQGVHRVQLVDQGVVELTAEALLELLVETNRGVVPDDLTLNLLDGQVRLVADALTAPDAEEVKVGAAVAVGFLNGEPAIAAGAPDRAFEVVVVLALSRAAAVPEREDTLYSVEQLGRDDSRVATFVLVALVGHVTDVIAVLEHFVERVKRGWLLGCAFRWTARQSGGRHGLMYLLAGVVACGIQLEGFEDERCPLLVQGDGAYLAPVDVFPDIEVADLGFTDAAAVLDLLTHLVGDVCAAGL
nr:hypothetical protein [Protofrankia symbiont of Coriaria ruscifolia]